MSSKADPVNAIKALDDRNKAERYTPSCYISLVREVLGEIDLDPASCEVANRTVKALRYYTVADDGLVMPWVAKTVFLNPPYKNMLPWVGKLLEEIAIGNVQSAILLANSFTDTMWFRKLCSRFSSNSIYRPMFCFVNGRIRFNCGLGGSIVDQPRYPSVFVYFGEERKTFHRVFKQAGSVMSLAI